jgi:hypothetical protein
MKVGNYSQTSQASSTYASVSYEKVSLESSLSQPSQESNLSEIPLDPKIRKMLHAIEALTGKKIEIPSLKREIHPNTNSTSPFIKPNLEYERIQYESSSLSVSFSGKLQNDTGKEINFSLSIEWREEFFQYEQLSAQSEREKNNPLIISFGPNPPVSSKKIGFNLPKNAHSLNLLNGDSGYLVLDVNENGKADNGGELFGPQTSDGFLELSQYDSDGNGWMDEGDEIFKQLYLWSPQKGRDGMITLKEAGIAAISLSTVNVDFTQKSFINEPVAHYDKAGIAINENGQSNAVFNVELFA